MLIRLRPSVPKELLTSLGVQEANRLSINALGTIDSPHAGTGGTKFLVSFHSHELLTHRYTIMSIK